MKVRLCSANVARGSWQLYSASAAGQQLASELSFGNYTSELTTL